MYWWRFSQLLHNFGLFQFIIVQFCTFLLFYFVIFWIGSTQIKSNQNIQAKKLDFQRSVRILWKRVFFGEKGEFLGERGHFWGGEWGFFGENVEFSEKYRIFGKMLDSRKHVEFLEKCGIFGFLEKWRIFLVECDFDWLGHKDIRT